MSQFDDITLLKEEYKILKKCNQPSGFPLSYDKAKPLLYKNLVFAENYSDLTNKNNVRVFFATDKGKRYIVWYKRQFVKSYYPIAISFVALGVSMIHIVLEICGVI